MRKLSDNRKDGQASLERAADEAVRNRDRSTIPNGEFRRLILAAGMEGREDGPQRPGRFGHHPDPAIDFRIEVEILEIRMHKAERGMSRGGRAPETVGTVLEDVRRAMSFVVGGDPESVRAKALLRDLDRRAAESVGSAPAPEPETAYWRGCAEMAGRALASVLAGRPVRNADEIIATCAGRSGPSRPESEGVAPPFQGRVADALAACFGEGGLADPVRRGDALLEEVMELLQADGYDRRRAEAMIRYVWSREGGDPAQEVGGVMLTLAGYCASFGRDMTGCGEAELARFLSKTDRIREKQAAKPAGDALLDQWGDANNHQDLVALDERLRDPSLSLSWDDRIRLAEAVGVLIKKSSDMEKILSEAYEIIVALNELIRDADGALDLFDASEHPAIELNGGNHD